MTPRATVSDLTRFDGRAELVAGRVVALPPLGLRPGRLVGRVVRSLDGVGGGSAASSTLAYVVPELPSGRESFSPAASFYAGPDPDDVMGPVLGPPTFAVELTHWNAHDTTPPADAARKRLDYFAAGTRVVWDVDPVAGTVTKYTAADLHTAVPFGPGDVADATPAVPGWRVAVDWLMRPGPNR